VCWDAKRLEDWENLIFVTFESYSFSIRWEKPGHSPTFGYDFWYQPRHNIMISSSWGAPAAFTKGFNLQHVADGLYGRHLNVYSWPHGELKQTLDLGDTGLLPLEVISLNIINNLFLWFRKGQWSLFLWCMHKLTCLYLFFIATKPLWHFKNKISDVSVSLICR